ncbi:unnamed protein product [Ectocarpus sp. 12 AP-2014]
MRFQRPMRLTGARLPGSMAPDKSAWIRSVGQARGLQATESALSLSAHLGWPGVFSLAVFGEAWVESFSGWTSTPRKGNTKRRRVPISMSMASPYPTYRSFKKHPSGPSLRSKKMNERNFLDSQPGQAL